MARPAAVPAVGGKRKYDDGRDDTTETLADITKLTKPQLEKLPYLPWYSDFAEELRKDMIEFVRISAMTQLRIKGVTHPQMNVATQRARVDALLFKANANWAAQSCHAVCVSVIHVACKPHSLATVTGLIRLLDRREPGLTGDGMSMVQDLFREVFYHKRNPVAAKALLDFAALEPSRLDLNTVFYWRTALQCAISWGAVPFVVVLANAADSHVLNARGLCNPLFQVCMEARFLSTDPAFDCLDTADVHLRMARALLSRAEPDGSGLRLDSCCDRTNGTSVLYNINDANDTWTYDRNDKRAVDVKRQLERIAEEATAAASRQARYRSNITPTISAVLTRLPLVLCQLAAVYLLHP